MPRLSRLLCPVLPALAAFVLAGCGTPPGPSTPAASPGDWSTAANESPARKRARLRLELASAYFQQGQDGVALEEVGQSLATDPGFAPAWNLRGLIFLNLAQWPLAEESFRRAQALAPDDADVLHNHGWLLCQQPPAQSRLAESEALFRQALARPGYTRAARTWAAMGWCQQRAGRLAQAESSLRQARALEPGNPRFGLMLAGVLHASGQWQAAAEELARLHAGHPPSAESLWLGIRTARKLDNPHLMQQLASQLRQQFGLSRQAQALDKGLFDE